MPEDMFEEIRELLSEERIYRFLLLQAIGLLHVIFDVLAFRSEIGFWKGQENMTGLSSRSVVFNALCTVIIYLYLLDSDGVNSIVLISYTCSTALELWKVYRVLCLRAKLGRESGSMSVRDGAGLHGTPEAPTLRVGDGSSATGDRDRDQVSSVESRRLEEETEAHDALATRTLGVGLAPLVLGWALYALTAYPHTSWYSWVISSLSDAVYLIGFIGMTPQLFINYRLKSVAHLPWRVLVYKAFNTFIDDIFSLLVSMPTLHRVACLRDDVVFVIFLYQRRIYPVDLRRANEYGYAYESSEPGPSEDAEQRAEESNSS